MKSVAIEREEMRARERARISSQSSQAKRGLRHAEERGFAARVVQALNLKKGLVDDATIAKLRVAGFRSQRQMTLFLFARAALGLSFLALALGGIFILGILGSKPFMIQLEIGRAHV